MRESWLKQVCGEAAVVVVVARCGGRREGETGRQAEGEKRKREWREGRTGRSSVLAEIHGGNEN